MREILRKEKIKLGKKEIQEWKTKSEKYERENQALQKSLESAMDKQEKLQVLSSDLERANKEQQEKIGQLQRMNEELQDKVTNDMEQHTDERDSAERERQTWEKEIQEWKTKSEEYERENQVLEEKLERAMEQLSSYPETANEEPQEQIRQLQSMNEDLHIKVTNERNQHRDERDSAARENQTWEKEIQKWKTKSEECELENQVLQESLESAIEKQGELKLLSSDLKTANEEQQEQIRQLQKMNEELQDKVTNEREQHKVERDSVLEEKQTLQDKIKELTIKNVDFQRRYRTQEKKYFKMSKKPEAVKETKQKTVEQLQRIKRITKVGDKVTKQKREFGEKLACKKRKEMTTAAAKMKELESETKAKTSLQAQVVELENKLKNRQKQMSEQEERLREETNTERLKSDRLEEEVSGLKSRLRETIGPGRIHSYKTDFDTRGVVYALARRTSSFGAGIIATRSCGNRDEGAGEPKDILEHQVKDGTVCATSNVKDSWWCVDLTEQYALYLTHYTLRHGQEQRGSVLRHWRLEGSLDGVEWTTLKEHENDTGLKGNKPYSTYTWAINGTFKAFRYFRIFQTGWHSSNRFGIFLSGIEMYGVLVEISS